LTGKNRYLYSLRGVLMNRRLFFILLTLLLPTAANAEDRQDTAKVTVSDVRYHHYATHTRVVIDVDQPALHNVTRVPDSRFLSVHLPHSTLGKTLRKRPILLLQGPLEKIEIKEEGPSDVFVLLAFKNPGEHQAMLIENPNRLVLDITHLPNQSVASRTPVTTPTLPPIVEPPARPPVPPELPPQVLQMQIPRTPPLLGIRSIMIDPGHGGNAPGAIGPTGLTEAEVVLDVALMVKKLIEDRLGIDVFLTRDQDTFIPLQDRTDMANQKKVDLFVSIHANASPKRSAMGIETYLFGRTTDKEVLAIAARENATNIKAAEDFQKLILGDLLRDFTINESLELAHYTQEAFVKTLIPEYRTKSLGVKKAPFYVLAHTEMPAILAEISFVSNRIEEERLRQNSYRQKVAESIFQGISAYIEEKS
jgi:N-acetylmuramoyl-L-alanine amidase